MFKLLHILYNSCGLFHKIGVERFRIFCCCFLFKCKFISVPASKEIPDVMLVVGGFVKFLSKLAAAVVVVIVDAAATTTEMFISLLYIEFTRS